MHVPRTMGKPGPDAYNCVTQPGTNSPVLHFGQEVFIQFVVEWVLILRFAHRRPPQLAIQGEALSMTSR